MKKQLNHSRYMDIYAKDIADEEYHRVKEYPTSKQRKFFKMLYAMCKEYNVETRLDVYVRTRMQYAMAIDVLIERLQKAGVEVEGNGEDVEYNFTHGSDRRGRYYTDTQIVVKKGEEKDESTNEI